MTENTSSWLSLLKNIEFNGVTLSALVFVAVFVLLIVIAISFALGSLAARIKLASTEEKRIKEALKKSRAVLGGNAAEQVAPFLPNFPCNPADARFVGKPVDFIAFPGAASDEPIKEILLIEVKTGGSQLSSREKEIRSCVEEGRVRYIEYRI